VARGGFYNCPNYSTSLWCPAEMGSGQMWLKYLCKIFNFYKGSTGSRGGFYYCTNCSTTLTNLQRWKVARGSFYICKKYSTSLRFSSEKEKARGGFYICTRHTAVEVLVNRGGFLISELCPNRILYTFLLRGR
jgi:hypothetical protein